MSFKCNKDEIINECLEPQEYWNNWQDYRDGFRGSKDRTSLRNKHMMFAKVFDVKRWNKKIKKLLKIRNAKKTKKIMNKKN